MEQTESVALLRPRQVEEAKEEIARIEKIDQGPDYVRAGVDLPHMRRYHAQLRQQLEAEAPKPATSGEIDSLISEERRLREQWLEGMPTQEEMRRNPPGAVDKHRRWESRNKKDVKAWKNIRLRLQASGVLDGVDSNSTDVANVEMYRPSGGSGQLNLDVAQIIGKDFHMPYRPNTVVFTDDEIDLLKKLAPDLADKLSMMPSAERQALREDVREHMTRITSASLESAGYNACKTLARHLGLDLPNIGVKKEDLFALILETHSGEPWPDNLAA